MNRSYEMKWFKLTDHKGELALVETAEDTGDYWVSVPTNQPEPLRVLISDQDDIVILDLEDRVNSVLDALAILEQDDLVTAHDVILKG